MLELALTPYDVLRLRRATGFTSEKLLNEYIIVEQEPGEAFPRFYLTMVDDGRDSCVFVGKEGCTVYEHRPGACRAYPLGRAVSRGNSSKAAEHFVLLSEPHCQGFLTSVRQTPQAYMQDQELLVYNDFNDAVLEILQHQTIRDGLIPSQKSIDLFTLALYNLDTFRSLLFEDSVEHIALSHAEKLRLQVDEDLLDFGIKTVVRQIFPLF